MTDILFVTDFVCPYCIVAKAALKQALKELGIQAEIRTQPMELTEEPGQRVDTYHDPKRKEHYQVLVRPAKELGLDVKLPPAVIPRPYTRLAWEGWHYAKENQMGDSYCDRMYQAYFIEELDIGDIQVLVRLAEEVGLNGEAYREALLDGRYRAAEKEATAYSRNVLQVKQVPTIYINGQEISLKDYTKEEMTGILRQMV